MDTGAARRRLRNRPLVAELLETRQLLSVSVTPRQVVLPTMGQGNGVITVALLSDASFNPRTVDVSSLTITASSSSAGPVTLAVRGSAHRGDLNHDHIRDLFVNVVRNGLGSLLPAGQHSAQVTIDIQGTTTSGGITSGVTDFGTATFNLIRPGNPVHGHSQPTSHPHGPSAVPMSMPGQAHPLIHVQPAATTGPAGYNPAQIRHAYGFDQLTGNGAGQTIAIIDAYDDPTIANDLRAFDQAFGLPDPTFVKVNQKGSTGGMPSPNASWALETSLDVEWAHAIAPGAKIVLVEAKTSGYSDLMAAVDTAVNKMGAHVVSMSWGGPDWSSETGYDSHFNKNGVVFTAASGDNGSGSIYPATSPYVVAVGGTSLVLDSSGNRLQSETAWYMSGGGYSFYENEPGYQKSYGINSTSGMRGTPDVAYNADPVDGFSVYDTTSYYGQSGWFKVGGTSAGAPQWAALFALADQGRSTPLSSNNLTNAATYLAAPASNPAMYASNFTDVVSGSNGSFSAGTGYDMVTGVGSPNAASLVPYLQSI